MRKHWSSRSDKCKVFEKASDNREGPTDANAYASFVCTYARGPITGELRKVPTVHILQCEKSLAPRRLMLDTSGERPGGGIVGINLAMTVAVLRKLLS